MPVDNNEHQRINWYTVTRDNLFRIVMHELFDCFVQVSQ